LRKDFILRRPPFASSAIEMKVFWAIVILFQVCGLVSAGMYVCTYVYEYTEYVVLTFSGAYSTYGST
jgi:hypothetical protein